MVLQFLEDFDDFSGHFPHKDEETKSGGRILKKIPTAQNKAALPRAVSAATAGAAAATGATAPAAAAAAAAAVVVYPIRGVLEGLKVATAAERAIDVQKMSSGLDEFVNVLLQDLLLTIWDSGLLTHKVGGSHVLLGTIQHVALEISTNPRKLTNFKVAQEQLECDWYLSKTTSM